MLFSACPLLVLVKFSGWVRCGWGGGMAIPPVSHRTSLLPWQAANAEAEARADRLMSERDQLRAELRDMRQELRGLREELAQAGAANSAAALHREAELAQALQVARSGRAEAERALEAARAEVRSVQCMVPAGWAFGKAKWSVRACQISNFNTAFFFLS